MDAGGALCGRGCWASIARNYANRAQQAGDAYHGTLKEYYLAEAALAYNIADARHPIDIERSKAGVATALAGLNANRGGAEAVQAVLEAGAADGLITGAAGVSSIGGAGMAAGGGPIAIASIGSGPTKTGIPPYERSAFGAWDDDIRYNVIRRDGGECVYCGNRDNLTVDHVVSVKQKWEEGAWEWTPEQRNAWFNDPSNLVTACRRCNSSKGDMDPFEWFMRLLTGEKANW